MSKPKQSENPTQLAVDEIDALVAPHVRPGRPSAHGLSARMLHVADEDRAIFNEFCYVMLEDIRPLDDTEMFFARQIVAQRWFLIHADQTEAACLRKIMKNCRRRPLAEPDDQTYYMPRSDDERDDQALAETATHNDTHLVLRYRTAHLRALQRMEHALWLYRKLKEAQDLPDNQTNYDNSPAEPPRPESGGAKP